MRLLSVVGNSIIVRYVDIEHIVSCDWLHVGAFTLKIFHAAIREDWRPERVPAKTEAFLWYCNM